SAGGLRPLDRRVRGGRAPRGELRAGEAPAPRHVAAAPGRASRRLVAQRRAEARAPQGPLREAVTRPRSRTRGPSRGRGSAIGRYAMTTDLVVVAGTRASGVRIPIWLSGSAAETSTGF